MEAGWRLDGGWMEAGWRLDGLDGGWMEAWRRTSGGLAKRSWPWKTRGLRVSPPKNASPSGIMLWCRSE